MWDSFKSLTSYQDLDGGTITLFLNMNRKVKFYRKLSLVEIIYLSGIRQKQEDQIYDDAFLNSEISLGETIAALQYLKEGKAAGPDEIFTDLLLHANEELEKSIHKLSLFHSKLALCHKIGKLQM